MSLLFSDTYCEVKQRVSAEDTAFMQHENNRKGSCSDTTALFVMWKACLHARYMADTALQSEHKSSRYMRILIGF